MIKALKNEFSSFFMNQSNLRAASIYLITSFALEPLVIIQVLESESIDLSVLLVLFFRLLQIGTGIWITFMLLSSKANERNHTRLIGLYIIFVNASEIMNLPNSFRGLFAFWDIYSPIQLLLSVSFRVKTILLICVTIKLLRKRIDKNLFLFLSFLQLMYILNVSYYTDFRVLSYIPEVQADVYFLSYLTSLALYSILVIVFLVISGKIHMWKDDERGVIKWVGVALFLIGFRTLLTLFTAFVYNRFFLTIMHSQGIYLLQMVSLPIVWVIQAIIVIYLGIRVRAHIPQK